VPTTLNRIVISLSFLERELAYLLAAGVCGLALTAIGISIFIVCRLRRRRDQRVAVQMLGSDRLSFRALFRK
jgi:hypothetical protein